MVQILECIRITRYWGVCLQKLFPHERKGWIIFKSHSLLIQIWGGEIAL